MIISLETSFHQPAFGTCQLDILDQLVISYHHAYRLPMVFVDSVIVHALLE